MTTLISEPLQSSTTSLPFTGTTFESTFTTSTNPVQLYTKTWTPASPSTIHLIFLHGFSDHINAYYNLFPILASAPYNITVHGFDQRGWGRSVHSKSQRGLTGGTDLVMNDIRDFHAHVSDILRKQKGNDLKGIKLFLAGHSMGGAESLTYLLSSSFTATLTSRNLVPISGLVVEAPHIAFPPASQPSALLVWSGRLAAKLLPNMQMHQQLNPNDVSRDPLVVQQWQDDKLCHDMGTLAGLAGLLDRAEHLHEIGSSPPGTWHQKHALEDRLPCPVFWAHGTADKICSFDASEKLYGRVNPSDPAGHEFKAYKDEYHKLHCEPNGEGETFARDVGNWILKVAGTGVAQEGTGTAASTSASAMSASYEDNAHENVAAKSKL